jgi:hypothetical protein
MQFEKLLERIASVLDQQSVPYMVIGGQAVLVHGEPRLTKDIDITVDLEPFNPEPLLRLVTQLGLKVLVSNPEAFLKETFVLPAIDTESGIRIDLICLLSQYEREAIQRGIRVPLGETTVNFIGLEDLVVHKIIAGRPRDIEDVRVILAKNKHANFTYIRSCLGQHDEGLGTDFLDRLEKVIREQQLSHD